MSSDDFLGVTPDVLLAVGKVVVGAGRLEAVTREVADLLGIEEPSRLQYSRLTDAIKRRVRDEPHLPLLRALPDPADLPPWISRAKSLMSQRDQRLHNDVLHASVDGSWAPHWVDARTGKLAGLDAADLDRLAIDLAAHSMRGLEMRRHMAYSVPQGQGWRARGH